MFAAFILPALIGCCIGTPLSAVWLRPIAQVAPVEQYQSQDGLGGYHYAYTGPHHSKVETRLGGMTRGGYSYIDANGILQTVAYTADALNGFRVQASNLPQQQIDEVRQVKDTPEVPPAKETHLEEMKKTEPTTNQGTNTWQVQQVGSDPHAIPQAFLDYSNPAGAETDNKLDSDRSEAVENLQHPFLLSKTEADKIGKDIPVLSGNLEAPIPVAPSNYMFKNDGQIQGFAPLPNIPHYVFPVVPYRLMHSSLHHTQDSLGQYDYTYTGDTSAKTESRALDGTTRGAYSYIDANGLLQQVHYIADHNGFRVAATNLPEAK